MPDLERIRDFLGRTQKWLQKSMDSGDQQGSSYFEGLMDRGGQLAERAMQQRTANSYAPVHTGDGSAYPRPAPPLGRVMMDSVQQGRYNPDEQYNVQSQEPPTSPAQAVTPPTPAVQMPPQQYTTSGQPLGPQVQGMPKNPFDVTSINQGDKIMMDLNQEVTGKGDSVSDWLFGEGKFQGQPYKTPDAGNLNKIEGPANKAEPKSFAQSWMNMEGLSTDNWAGNDPAPFSKLPKPGDVAAKIVEQGLNPSKPTKVVNAPPPVSKPGELPIRDISGEPEVMPSKYEADPSFRERIDMMGSVKKTATDPFEKEFLTRVERELGKKPSFFTFETLAMLLLMGAPRAYQNFQNQKQQYATGKRDIAKEMRGEMNRTKSNDYRLQKDQLDRELQYKKIAAQYQTGAVKAALQREEMEYERLGKDIAAMMANPGVDPANPPQDVIRMKNAQIEVLKKMDRMLGANYGTNVKGMNE